MHAVSLLHLRTLNPGSKTEQPFTEKKSRYKWTCVVQTMLFRAQLYLKQCIQYQFWLKSLGEIQPSYLCDSMVDDDDAKDKISTVNHGIPSLILSVLYIVSQIILIILPLLRCYIHLFNKGENEWVERLVKVYKLLQSHNLNEAF